MRILVTGANGFIGAQIVAALTEAGHAVVRAIRGLDNARHSDPTRVLSCDFARDTDPEVWLPRLSGIDAVVNCAGILREHSDNTFEAVHVRTPRALFQACVKAGVSKIVQISAIGEAADGEFVASKHRADDHLKTLDLNWVIVRPSIVYTPAGSYGGTSLLRALAALPFFLFLPVQGRQLIQPIAADDLARIVVKAVESHCANRRVVEAVGPEPITLAHYLTAWRRWLGIPPARSVNIPLWLAYPFARLGELFGKGPLGITMYRMLQRGNVATPEAVMTLATTFGFTPKSLEQTLATRAAFVQDRWHARLYFIRPLLRLTLAAVWIVSGVAGFLFPVSESAALLIEAGIPAVTAAPLVYAASTLDVALGLLLLARIKVPLTGLLMLLSAVAYTLFLGLWLPMLWLDPFGGLVKNLALVSALAALLAMEEHR